MRILITNDDGVEAAQLSALIKWASKLGEVTTFVPKYEQSGKSHSFEIKTPFEVKQVQLEEGITVWTVDSTPADCVRMAVLGMGLSFDLVISGINRGYNLGKDTMYSGTLAAATEAVTKGMKAIALSASVKYYDQAIKHLDEILHYLEENRLWERHILYNVNIPVNPRGIRITRLGDASFSEEFIPMGNDLYFPGGKSLRADGCDITQDTNACALGYISITPMTTDRTELAVYRALEELNP